MVDLQLGNRWPHCRFNVNASFRRNERGNHFGSSAALHGAALEETNNKATPEPNGNEAHNRESWFEPD
jgi:hypothetical protein